MLYENVSRDKYVVFVCLIHGILDTQIHFHIPGSNKEIVKKMLVNYIDLERSYVCAIQV
jgi:hypothetical protein